jgi:hypothetical protein
VAINDGDVVVSKIYDWFIEDFGGDEAGVFSHLLRYAAPDLGAQLMSNKKLTGTKYDWSLNAGEN